MPFRTVAGQPVGAGVHLINPFASVQRLSVRTESYTMSASTNEGNRLGDDSVSVLGSDGAQANVDATVLFRLNTGSASTVYKQLGSEYVEKVVRPTIRTCIRDGFATPQMVVAATTMRTAVAGVIQDCIAKNFVETTPKDPHSLVLERFQLRAVHLSSEVQKSIDAKVKAQQSAEQQQFELQAATQKAEISRVEAQGKADAQQIISCGGSAKRQPDGSTRVVPNTGAACQNTLTPAYLQFLYIQTLQATVNSPNHSTLILPFDQKLTPLRRLGAG